MPLKRYIAEMVGILKDSPQSAEIVLEPAKAMRFAERGDHDASFVLSNEGWLASQER